MYIGKERLQELRNAYPPRSRIRLIEMGCDPITGKPDPQPIPPGSIGYVNYVDDAGHIHVRWQNGSSLSLIEGVDKFVVED